MPPKFKSRSLSTETLEVLEGLVTEITAEGRKKLNDPKYSVSDPKVIHDAIIFYRDNRKNPSLGVFND